MVFDLGKIIRDFVKKTTQRTFIPKATPSYTISVASTPAGKTRTTSGGLISTPGTPARVGYTSTIRRGGGSGGGGSSAQRQAEARARELRKIEEGKRKAEAEAKKKAEAEAKKKDEEEKRLLEEIKKASVSKQQIERAKIESFRKLELDRRARDRKKEIQRGIDEQKRIDQLRTRIKNLGGQTRTTTLKEAGTGATIIQTVTNINRLERGKVIRERVFEQRNLRTGKVIIKTFQRDPKTGRTFQSGGVSFTEGKEDFETRKALESEKKRLNKGVKEGKLTQSEAKRLYDSFVKLREKQTAPKTLGFISAVKKPENYSFLTKSDQWLTNELNKLETERLRTSQNSPSQFKIGALTTVLAAFQAGTGLIIGFKNLPTVIKYAIENPKILKELPATLKRNFIIEGESLRISPTRTIVRLGTEMFLMSGTGKVLKTLKKLKTNTVSKLSPRFRALKLDKIKINFPKTGKYVEFTLGTVKTVKESLKKQLKLAGTTQPLVTTAQANKLLSFFRKEKLIKKPLPLGIEGKLSSKFRRLLQKFDEKKISLRDFKELEKHLQTKFGKSLLERSLYVDPLGRLRASRLGIGIKDQLASIKDILRGNFRLFKDKPQIIFFRNVQVQAFPKTAIFRRITNKLRTGKPLTLDEITALVEFQVKKSGKFKPIGSTTWSGGIEPELTIAPGEIIKRVKDWGFTIIKGQKVKIVEAKIIKGSSTLNKLLDKFKLKTISKKEISQLKKLYKKETNVKLDLRQARNIVKRPLFRPKVISKLTKISKIARAVRIRKAIRKKELRIGSTRKRGVVRSPRTRISPRVPRVIDGRAPRVRDGRAPRVIDGRAPRVRDGRAPRAPRPVPTSPKKSPIKIPRGKTRVKFRILSQPAPVYKIVIKKLGKKKTLLKNLVLKDAKDFMAYNIDKTLIRTASVVPMGIKKRLVVRLPRNVSGEFTRVKKKLRPYRVKKGKRFPLEGRKFIERKKFVGDTKEEQLLLQLARLKKKRAIKRKVITKKKAVQRRTLKKNKSKLARLIKKRKALKKKRTIKKIVKKTTKRKLVKKRVVRRKKSKLVKLIKKKRVVKKKVTKKRITKKRVVKKRRKR